MISGGLNLRFSLWIWMTEKIAVRKVFLPSNKAEINNRTRVTETHPFWPELLQVEIIIALRLFDNQNSK